MAMGVTYTEVPAGLRRCMKDVREYEYAETT